MEEVEFRIIVNAPFIFTVDTATTVVSRNKSKWRITRMALQRLKPNTFECRLGIDSRDVSRDNHADLVEFRDTFLSLLALIATVPVRPLIKGTFDFPLGDNKFAQLSLGPMEYEFPESPIISFGPLVEGFAFDEGYRAAVWFLWQATNSGNAVHRFLNLAISYELIVGKNSGVKGSKSPVCNSCGKEIPSCPHCQKDLRIPPSLRERAEFMFEKHELLDAFIKYRNRMFHGRVADVTSNSPELKQLNADLLVNLRNYLGQRIGMGRMTASEISAAVNVPDVMVTVFYENKT